MKAIALIGFGNMGEALAKGLKAKFPDLSIGFIEKNSERARVAKSLYGARDFGEDYAALAAFASLTVLAVKPQDADTVLEKLRPHAAGIDLVSILAGKTLSFFAEGCPSPNTARFMPNLAASIAKAFVGVSFSGTATEEFKNTALAVASCFGSARVVPERLMGAVVGLSGSGIAFAFEYLHAMALAGCKEGFSYQDSLSISLEVLIGAAELLKDNAVHPIEMVSRVCSPAGTTIEGIKVLEDRAFASSVMAAVEAASKRARELE